MAQICIAPIKYRQRKTDFNQRQTDFMEITFTDTKNETLTLTYPREFAANSYIDERTTSTNTDWGQLSLKESWFEGACLLQSRFLVDKQCAMQVRCNSFCWLMNFVFSGDITSATGTDVMRLQQGSYQTFYCTELDMQLQITQPTETFTICLTNRFIRKLLGKDLPPEQFTNGNNALTMVISDSYQHNRLRMLLAEMRQADQPPVIRRIFLEARILELLYLQLDQLQKQQQLPADFSREDIDRLNDARRIIAQDLQNPCSLLELARRAGLNDYKLKRGFKLLFGHTVFGYLTELRMEKARELLKKNFPVGETAEAVGYKNPQHFTTAFKKHFGVLPSKV